MCYNNPEPAAKKERTGTFLFEDTGGNKMEEINYQQKFEELFCTHIKREGAQHLLEWLKKTDFFSAPASTKYHCACQHGLVMHSISVFETMAERFFEEGDSMESFAICGLSRSPTTPSRTSSRMDTGKNRFSSSSAFCA